MTTAPQADSLQCSYISLPSHSLSHTHTHTHIYICTQKGWKEMCYLTTHSTHFIYGYMVSESKRGNCCHMGYSFRLTARVLLYAPSHRQDSTYHGCIIRGALAGTRNSSTPWRIDPTTHRIMSERSYHGATSRSHTHINTDTDTDTDTHTHTHTYTHTHTQTHRHTDRHTHTHTYIHVHSDTYSVQSVVNHAIDRWKYSRGDIVFGTDRGERGTGL